MAAAARPSKKGVAYWLPRTLVAGSVAAVLLPAPDYLKGLSPEEQVVWWVRLLWVAWLTLPFALAMVAALWLGRRGAGKKPPKTKED